MNVRWKFAFPSVSILLTLDRWRDALAKPLKSFTSEEDWNVRGIVMKFEVFRMLKQPQMLIRASWVSTQQINSWRSRRIARCCVQSESLWFMHGRIELGTYIFAEITRSKSRSFLIIVCCFFTFSRGPFWIIPYFSLFYIPWRFIFISLIIFNEISDTYWNFSEPASSLARGASLQSSMESINLLCLKNLVL